MLAFVENRILPLRLSTMPTLPELDYQCAFVKFFIQAWLERILHDHRRADNRFAKFLVN